MYSQAHVSYGSLNTWQTEYIDMPFLIAFLRLMKYIMLFSLFQLWELLSLFIIFIYIFNTYLLRSLI